MAYTARRFENNVLVDVSDTFDAEDVIAIEVLLDGEPTDLTVEVDLTRAAERHPLALWLLACMLSRSHGRCRVAGLTASDLRFLVLAGEDPDRWMGERN